MELLRESILRVVPDAEQCISYGMPAFKVEGKVVAGFAAFKNHLSYLPHSGSVLDQLGEDLAGRSITKGSLHFPIDQPLPDELVERLISVRLQQAIGDRGAANDRLVTASALKATIPYRSDRASH